MVTKSPIEPDEQAIMALQRFSTGADVHETNDSYTPIAFTALSAISEMLVKPNGQCIAVLAN
jgi:hypothetical protein